MDDSPLLCLGFLLANVASSFHMLWKRELWHMVRFTSITQHCITAYSALLTWNAAVSLCVREDRWPRLKVNELLLGEIHLHVALVAHKVVFLFPGMLAAFCVGERMVKRRKVDLKKDDDLGSRKVSKGPTGIPTPQLSSPASRPWSVYRVVRNLYTHLGSALVLWYTLPPGCIREQGSRVYLHNVPFIAYLLLACPSFSRIYGAQGMDSTGVVLSLIPITLLHNLLLYWQQQA
mmetsp:Transcript_8314/g.30673  ORF Transcript_8314/g.30673 Transcript_8314/m.30673 type:complete len:233 (+) Transcript_8314:134-832(+)